MSIGPRLPRKATRWLAAGTAASLAVTLPSWLPPAVVALRVRIFTRVNGDEGIPVPSRQLPAGEFKEIYGHPAAHGRSRGAALSDLFWYWLSPGPEVHQEHLEPGPRYDDVARTTRRILAGLSKEEWGRLVERCARRVLDRLDPDRIHHVRLRDLMMPIWAEVYYELVFQEPCPPEARRLIVGNARDVINALKCTSLRHMERREKLTRYLLNRIKERADGPDALLLPAGLSMREQAYYLQGTFFNTAVVQMSEAMAHLLMAIATHPAVQDRLLTDLGKADDRFSPATIRLSAVAGGGGPDGDGGYLDRVIDETLRLWPLFGVAHRITTAEIPREGRSPIPAGSVLLFNYSDYQMEGFAGDERFDPDRWLSPDAKQANFIPFGVTANRPCPARGFATLTMRVAAREVLRRFRLDSPAAHTRSLPSRGPCLLVPHDPADPYTSPGARSSYSAYVSPGARGANSAHVSPGARDSFDMHGLSDAHGSSGARARYAAYGMVAGAGGNAGRKAEWLARRRIMRWQDRWESVPRSLTQLALGSYMVWDARRQGLCRTYFDRRQEA
jgi:cytochrome P450